jgi:reductive dehalogenase
MNEFNIIGFLTTAIGIVIFLSMLFTTFVSIKERERVAAWRAFFLALFLPLPYIIVGQFTFIYQSTFALFLISFTGLAVLLLVLPLQRKEINEDDQPGFRIDERDTMFSRYHLEKDPTRFNEYYQRNPDKKELDDLFRAKSGLLQSGAIFHDTFTFSAAQASFNVVESFHPILDTSPIRQNRILSDPLKITNFIKKWAKKLGSVSVGITLLRDYHLYSYIGRGKKYGQPVHLKHKFAIVITVEMDKYMLDRAPYGPTLMESAQQYLACGAIAVQITEFIRNLGYPARAHIDGNYRVVCPLVAWDAGLGEIGRMGLLMTPILGPRVRIAVVTTDLPLVPDNRQRDNALIDFCTKCKKCAEICPSNAIPFDDRTEIDGVKRWQINSEACFTYWCSIGTDCGRCVSVCPYSHPDSLLHNLVRVGVRNSWLFRKFALTMDDFLYGRKPAPSDIPKWMELDDN